MISGKRRILILVLLMTAIAIAAMAIALRTAHKAAFLRQRDLLVAIARSQVQLVEAVARYDAEHAGLIQEEVPTHDPYRATLAQVREAYEHFEGIGETGEFTLARREGDRIIFLLRHRHGDFDSLAPVPLTSALAEPMRRALGGESGWVVGLDYRGEKVLAAYEHVNLMNLGIVAKIDMAEVRAPFVRAGLQAAAGTLALVLIGSVVLLRIGTPLVTAAILEREFTEAAIDAQADTFFLFDPAKGKALRWNTAFRQVSGFTDAEIAARRAPDDWYSQEDVEKAKRCVAIAIEEGTATVELDLIAKDGARIPTEYKAGVIRDGDGNPRQIIAAGRDLRGRRQAEDALRDSEARFRAIFDQAAVGVAQIETATGRFLHVNRRYCEIVGLSPEEMISTDFMRISHPGDLQLDLDNMERLKAGEIRSFSMDKRYFRPDGSIVWVTLTVSPMWDVGEQPSRHIGVVEDITERRRAEDALRESESRLIHSQRLAHLGNWVWDAATDKVEWSREVYRIFGVDPDQFRPEIAAIAERFHPEDRHLFSDVITEAREGGSELSFSTRIIRPDGTLRYLISTSEGIRDEAGGLTAVQGTVQDVTEARVAEQTLRESEEQHRVLFEQNADALAVVDPATGQIIDFNDRACENLGYTREEFEKITLADLEVVESNEDIDEHIQKIVHEGEDVFETKHRTKDGLVRDILVISRAITIGGRGLIQSVWHDITERKRAEEERRRLGEQIQQAQKMESLGVLAGGIAHDFNNLLMGVLGNASLALDELPNEAPARYSVEQIEVAARRAADLTTQMLAYSGKGRFVIQALDLSALVEEMLHLIKVSISKKVALKLNLADDLPAIRADATQIRQIVLNLITNASEAIGDHSGVIAVTTGVLDCDRDYIATTLVEQELEPGVFVTLEVSDSGEGMDSRTQARIFDPFFTTKFTGRGLGLAAALGIVRGHRGLIRVYSEPGRGTTFKVLLPATRDNAEMVDVRRAADARWQGSGLILVADDEETVRALARRILERAGFEVITSEDGRQTVEIFNQRNEDISLVLLDMTMPHLDGEQVFRELRRVKTDVRVVLSSGYNEQDATQNFAGKGLAGFIQKPYSPGELVAKIREVLGD